MGERVHALTVALDDDCTSEQLRPIVEAVQMIKGVSAVETHAVDSVNTWSARQRTFHRFCDALLTVMKALREGKDIKVVEREGS